MRGVIAAFEKSSRPRSDAVAAIPVGKIQMLVELTENSQTSS